MRPCPPQGLRPKKLKFFSGKVGTECDNTGALEVNLAKNGMDFFPRAVKKKLFDKEKETYLKIICCV
jgi:hypothetical protein